MVIFKYQKCKSFSFNSSSELDYYDKIFILVTTPQYFTSPAPHSFKAQSELILFLILNVPESINAILQKELHEANSVSLKKTPSLIDNAENDIN